MAFMKSDHRGVGSHVVELSEEMSSGLDIFDIPKVDTSIKAGKTVYHHLSTAINENNNVFEFLIPSENHEYTYLPLTRLEGELQITKTDGTLLGDADGVMTVNLFSNTVFRQIEVELNGVQVADLSSPTYHYKAYIESHLTYGKDPKRGHLKNALYTKEIFGQEESLDGAQETYLERRAWLKKDEGKLRFSTPLYIDLFDSQRYLIPGTTMKIKLIKNDNKLCLMSAAANADSYKFKINKLCISTRKLTIHDEIVERHSQMLLKQPAIYPIAQSKIKTYTINQGLSATTIANVFNGKLPRTAIIGMVRSDAFNGTIDKNPFFFQPFHLNYLALVVNGSPMPATVFQPNFAKRDIAREYAHFLDNLGVANSNEHNDVDLYNFESGSCFFPFDFSPDYCNNYHSHLAQSGTVNLELRFATALAQHVTLIVYATYNEILTIDGTGKVMMQ